MDVREGELCENTCTDKQNKKNGARAEREKIWGARKTVQPAGRVFHLFLTVAPRPPPPPRPLPRPLVVAQCIRATGRPAPAPGNPRPWRRIGMCLPKTMVAAIERWAERKGEPEGTGGKVQTCLSNNIIMELATEVPDSCRSTCACRRPRRPDSRRRARKFSPASLGESRVG